MDNVNISDLNELDPKNILSMEDEADVLALMMNQPGLEDWDYNMETQALALKVRFINKSRNADPTYQNQGDSGFDLMADLPEGEERHILPLKRVIIPTGLYYQIPLGFELQVRSRSGLAAKNGIMVLNSPGTVDSGYRGEVKVILFNTDDQPFVIKNGDRIAQGVICAVQHKGTVKFNKVETLGSSDRGTGGFGSTGV